MAGKRKRLTLNQKIDIIDESEKSGLSARKLAEKFEVGRTQVATLLQNKHELRNLLSEGTTGEQKKKFPKTKGFAIDQLVFNWFCKARSNHLPISGRIIQEKALEVARSIGINDFKASNGWLDRFSHRHDITFKAICEEPEIDVVSNITNLSEACASLRDLETFFMSENNSDMVADISKLLLKCESDFLKLN